LHFFQTFCLDSQVADSACSATAYLCGTKGHIGTIGVTAQVTYRDCRAQMNTTNQAMSILAWAQVGQHYIQLSIYPCQLSAVSTTDIHHPLLNTGMENLILLVIKFEPVSFRKRFEQMEPIHFE